jgi:hypothetical protein
VGAGLESIDCYALSKNIELIAAKNSNAVAEHVGNDPLFSINLMLQIEKFALDIGTGKAIAVMN